MGTHLPPEKNGTLTVPNFWPVYYGQTVGWINVPLGTEVIVESGDVVLDVVAALPKRGTAPSFRFMSIVA